jgi:hypothetical protein
MPLMVGLQFERCQQLRYRHESPSPLRNVRRFALGEAWRN